MLKFIGSLLVLLMFTPVAFAERQHPNCSGPNRWPARSAQVLLQNRDILPRGITDITVERLASEPLDGGELYRQMHLVTYKTPDGPLRVITVNDVSFEECSMSAVQVYIIEQSF